MDNTGKKQWSGKSRGGAFGYRFFIFTIKLLGIKCAYCFLSVVLVYFIIFAPKSTRSIWYYNRKIRKLNCFRSLTELYLHYYVFGQTMIDKVAVSIGLNDKYNFKFENYDRFIDIIKGDNGVVMIGAHVGCWEIGSVFFGNYGKRINIVMLDDEHKEIKDVVESNSNNISDYKIIGINKDPLDTILKIKTSLNNGEYVCFKGDRYFGTQDYKDFMFMGRKAPFPTGPFKISKKSRLPLIFYYAVREADYTYRFIFEEVKVENFQSYEQLIEEYIKSLENIVGKYPRQWFNFYEFWYK